jgi:NTE family protein
MPMPEPDTRPPIALILSGGGARAAYQVGVLRAIAEVQSPGSPLPFRIVCGNSAGALNAAFLAADARHFDRAVRSLDQLWTSLSPGAIYRTESMRLLAAALRMVRAFFRPSTPAGDVRAPALLDSSPLAALLSRCVDFAGIQSNIDQGYVSALAITAFSYTLARSVTFCQTTPDQPMWARAQRRGIIETITARHLLASSAIPFLFPSVRIGDQFYGDGSMRQVAPTSPALHLGASRIFVIGVARSSAELRSGLDSGQPPSLAAIGAQMLAIMFADAIASDLERVRLVNAAVRQIPPETRSASPVPLRDVDLLSISPSVSLESYSREHIRHLPGALRRAFGGGRAPSKISGSSAGLASYLLFDGDFCRELIALGRRDAQVRMEEIKHFLAA